ncbi:MAG TPA: SH3 domain-containing protein [Pyrinomonadaceae bacterium]|jgi:hypothetical protein
MSKYHVNTSSLNLREGPGTSHDIVAELTTNAVVEKLEVSDNGFWFRVKAKKAGADVEGWVAGEFLEAEEKIGWVDRIGDFEVERKPIPRVGNKPFLLMEHPMIGVLHTTEGGNIKGAFNALNSSHSAPHFIAGENRIMQCRPMTAQGAALKTPPGQFPNKFAAVQIEMVGFSKETPWLPPDSALLPVLAIMRWAAESPIDIPLRRPSDEWLDDCSDVPKPWAVKSNRRRTSGLWSRQKGWYMHMEVPGNDHWDCGAIRWTDIFNRI